MAQRARLRFTPPWTDDYSTRNVRFFSYRVPNLPGTAQVRLVGPSGLLSRWGLLAARAVDSNHEPWNGATVRLVGGRIHVAWTASDADHDQLSFSVAYSNDGGRTWMTEALQTTNTSIDIPVARGAHNHLVRVYATDGGRSAVKSVRLTTR